MRTKLSFLSRFGIAFLPIPICLTAAPLTWFPGPPLDSPRSGAATVVVSGNNLLIGGDSSAVQSLAATNIYWSYFIPFEGAAVAPGAVATGGLIIFYGGNNGTGSISDTIGYSTTDVSTELASMSTARSQLGYAPDRNGRAYAIGGLGENGQPLSSGERYDQDLNSWAPIANLPSSRYNFPAVFNRTNYIYIFGGSTNSSGAETASVLRYSVSANSWSAMTPMPVAVAGSAAALGADGKIYVAGGVAGALTTNIVQVYDPAANSWTISEPLPEALSASAMGTDSLGRLVVMGGKDADGNGVSDVWRSQLLAAPDTAPVFVSYPSQSAKFAVPYISSISATGNPQPTYLLVTGPNGMNVDPYGGDITWTPQADQIGTNSVTIRAANYAGFADWNFTITVPNPPPTNPTNLTVVHVTDNSVTLAWDPEDPVVGPVTYRAYLKHVLHDPRGSGSTVWYTQIGTNTTIPTMTIAGLTPGLSQAYYINASGSGGTSGYTAISATTTAPQGPPALFVTGLTSTSVSLAWQPSPGPAQNPLYSPIVSYTIMERKTSPIANIPTVIGITGTNGTVTGLTPGNSHIWFVSGVDAEGNASALTYVYVVVTNPIPVAASLNAASFASDGSFQFSVTEGGSILQTVLIQATTNPADPNSWQQIGSLLPTSNPFTFADSNAAQYPVRFYRIVAP
jgi:Kelch motif